MTANHPLAGAIAVTLLLTAASLPAAAQQTGGYTGSVPSTTSGSTCETCDAPGLDGSGGGSFGRGTGGTVFGSDSVEDRMKRLRCEEEIAAAAAPGTTEYEMRFEICMTVQKEE